MIPLAVTDPENPDDHVARPEASEVRIFPSHGDHHVIFTCQLTPSFAHGVDVPIPKLPLAETVNTLAPVEDASEKIFEVVATA